MCFHTEPGDQSSRFEFHNGRPPRDANYVTVLSLLEMHAAGMSGNPNVILLRRVFRVQRDLILIYYWGGLCSAAPTGSSPCSVVLRHLRAVNALVCE